ncbi:DUF6907 domain-containing protein [Streptomyces sp. LMG1-1-1.1]|uniref:DUF6907 domain-containing protein n=1 Tax=Streptomyces sp. LMG1-1-1.1 TaxID=3135245 RepID=UPI00346618EC
MSSELSPALTNKSIELTEPVCPPWCVGKADETLHEVHEGARIEWLGPEPGSSRTGPALSASIALLEEGPESLQPEIWFGSSGSWTELNLTQFGSAIDELEEYVIALRALRYRYAAVLHGTDLASRDAYANGPKHPAEITALCPAWCNYRDEDGMQHSDEALEDRFHCSEHEVVELSLHQPRTDHRGNLALDEVLVNLEQAAYHRLPAVALTIEREAGSFCSLSLPEARQLRAVLGKLIAQAEVCATPTALPPLEMVAAHMRAEIADDPKLEPKYRGYALADTSPDGRMWVCIPQGLPSDLREETIRCLLAGAFEAPLRREVPNAAHVPLQVTGDRAAWAAASARAAA